MIRVRVAWGSEPKAKWYTMRDASACLATYALPRYDNCWPDQCRAAERTEASIAVKMSRAAETGSELGRMQDA